MYATRNIFCLIGSLQRGAEKSLKSQAKITQILGAVKQIVTLFNYSSIAQKKLKFSRQEPTLPDHQLVQDLSTRWNSHILFELPFIKKEPSFFEHN